MIYGIIALAIYIILAIKKRPKGLQYLWLFMIVGCYGVVIRLVIELLIYWL